MGDVAMIAAGAGAVRFDEAKQLAVRAVEITTEVRGKDDVKTVSAKAVLAIVYQSARKFSEAEPLLREAVQGMERALGNDSAEATRYRIEIARACLETGRVEEAENVCSRCVDVVEQKLGTQSYFPGVENSLSLLAEIAGRTGHQANAEARLTRLVDTVEKRLGGDHPLLAKVLMQAGEARVALGSDGDAKKDYQRCLAIQRVKLGPSHPDVAHTLQRLGLICLHSARYSEAEPLYQECLDTYRKSLGNEDLMVADGLCELGFLYMRTNRYPEAEKTFQESVAIAEKNPGVAADTLEGTLANWGRLCGETGRFDMAESLLKRALTMARDFHGEQHPHVAWNLVYLAQTYWQAGRFSDAEPLYRQAIAIFETTEGKGHPDTHVPLTDLGGVLCALGRYDEAEPLLRQSLGLAKNGWSMNDRDRICTMEALAEVHLRRGQWKEAISRYMEAQQTQRCLLSHILPGLSPAEQMVYLASTRQESLARRLSLGLSHSEKAEAVNASAEWLLNGKAISAELLAEQIRLARQANDPALAATVKELAAVRGQLAHLVLSPAQQSSGGGAAAAGATLARRESELSRRLGQQTLSAMRESPWVTLDEVRKNLPAQSVLIEIAKFPVYHSNTKGPGGTWDAAHYVAWVIPPAGAGDTTLVDLGDAEPIDGAVAKCRLHMESFRQAAGTVGIEQATKMAMLDIARLSAMVWQPLAKATNDAKSLIISPDGGLWLYPWEALSDREASFLVEKRQISYLVTGRQIAVKSARKTGSGAAIFADPDYDAEPAEAKSGHPNAWSEATRSLLGEAAPKGLLGNATVRPLSGAAAEVDAFTAALRSYVAAAPNVYRGKQASEGEFKKLQSPRVLVISTHGFFLPDQAFDNMPLTDEAKRLWTRYNVSRFFGLAGKNEQIVPNPLLRCGLALAGANRHRDAAEADDGVLTGLEILGADLHGTELVVLRACESGVGAVRDAEGTAGLHYAFQLTGAETVVATLWPIPVKPSSELMRTFFDNLVKKQGKAEALRNAHVSLIHQVRKDTGGAHPALWAGFAIIGNQQ